MNAVINFFKQNKPAATLFVAALLVIVAGFALQGCGLGDMIRHDVPKDMQEFNDDEPKVSLNDAPFVMEDYLSSVERNVRQFNEANDKANLVFDFVNSAITIGIEEIGNAPIPGAGFLSMGLMGLGGLMIRKPGTAREIADEKMASFNKGQQVALGQAKAFVSEENMRQLLAALKNGEVSG